MLTLLCLLAAAAVTATTAQDTNNIPLKTPEYILPCNKSQPDVNVCLRGTFNHLRGYLVDGLPDIGVPSIEPLVISRLSMENGAGAVRVRALFQNITVLGASNYTVGTIDADLDNYSIILGLTIPRIEVRGRYEVGGNVLLFPVRSKGDFWAAFGDVDAIAQILGKEVTRDGIRYMRIEKLAVDFKLRSSRFRVRDIINTGNVIGEAMNRFLNNNADEIIEEMKPAAAAAIARHFKAFLNNAFLKIPLQVWLPDA